VRLRFVAKDPEGETCVEIPDRLVPFFQQNH
jgi:hypothetical protein